jgi:uncharacterized protein YaaW (UPF0174 family)
MILHAKGQTYMLLKIEDFLRLRDMLFKIVILDFKKQLDKVTDKSYKAFWTCRRKGKIR